MHDVVGADEASQRIAGRHRIVRIGCRAERQVDEVPLRIAGMVLVEVIRFLYVVGRPSRGLRAVDRPGADVIEPRGDPSQGPGREVIGVLENLTERCARRRRKAILGNIRYSLMTGTAEPLGLRRVSDEKQEDEGRAFHSVLLDSELSSNGQRYWSSVRD